MRYDYECIATRKVLEVEHKLSESIDTWGQLCERAGVEPGDTPLDSPVRRLITGVLLIGGKQPNPCGASSCGDHVHSGGCCRGGACSF